MMAEARAAQRAAIEAELRRSIASVARILERGEWPTGLELTRRERGLLEVALRDMRDRLARRGAWAR